MQSFNSRRNFAGLLSAVILFPFGLAADDRHSHPDSAAARIAYHYIGRVTLNFTNGTGVVYGYFSDLAGVTPASALFQGAFSETTALLTFRANISFQSLAPNGPLSTDPGQFAVTAVLVAPGPFAIYYGAGTAHNWNDPNTFSSGRLVATLERDLEQFSVLSTLALNAGSADLQGSVPFTLNEQIFNFRSLIPNGVTNVTTGPAIPLAGSTMMATTFGIAGYGLTIGK